MGLGDIGIILVVLVAGYFIFTSWADSLVKDPKTGGPSKLVQDFVSKLSSSPEWQKLQAEDRKRNPQKYKRTIQ